MSEFEQFSADVRNAFELVGGQKSYDVFVRLISASVEQQTENRIIKLLEAECDCDFFEKYEIPSRCYAHKHIALIKGEK